MRIVFFGTSSFAVPSLESLAAADDVVMVVTRPDRPAGRGLALTPSPVKRRALELGLDVRTPERLDAPFVADVGAARAEAIACASYGKIIPQALLDVVGGAALNVHPSLLPAYRGATPIQSVLRDARDRTGVTIIWMDAKMDAGDVALRRETAIAADEDFGSLHDRLALLGGQMLAEAVRRLEAGTLGRTPQDHGEASYTKPILKESLHIDPASSARDVVALVRSASPRPGAWTHVDGVRVKVLAARAEPRDAAPLTADGPSIAASDGRVRLLRVIPEGRRAMSGAEFARLRRS